jgi:hypothetical protein
MARAFVAKAIYNLSTTRQLLERLVCDTTLRRICALMKLLGHTSPEMTMRYVEVASNDLQREFHLARSQPRHLAPHPKAPTISPRAGLDGVVDSLLFAQHAIEMFRRTLPDGPPRNCLDRLSNRLTKILSETRKLRPPDNGQRLAR